MKSIIPFTLLAGFIALAIYSQQPRPSAESLFIERKLAEYQPPSRTRELDDAPLPAAHRTLGFKHRQAQALAEVWQLSDAEAAKPVDLFGEGKR